MQVLKLVAAGLMYKEIADELKLSKCTIEKHIDAIHSKLKIRDRVHLAHYALAHGLIENKWRPHHD